MEVPSCDIEPISPISPDPQLDDNNCDEEATLPKDCENFGSVEMKVVNSDPDQASSSTMTTPLRQHALVETPKRPSSGRPRSYVSLLKSSSSTPDGAYKEVPTSSRPGVTANKFFMSAINGNDLQKECPQGIVIPKPRNLSRELHKDSRHRQEDAISIYRIPKNLTYRSTPEGLRSYGGSPWRQVSGGMQRGLHPRGRMVALKEHAAPQKQSSTALPTIRKRPAAATVTSSSCQNGDACKGVHSRSGHQSRRDSPRSQNGDTNNRKRSLSPLRYVPQNEIEPIVEVATLVKPQAMLSPLGTSPERLNIEIEKAYSERALRKCKDTDVRRLLSYDNLRITYKTMSISQETVVGKGLYPKGSTSLPMIQTPDSPRSPDNTEVSSPAAVVSFDATIVNEDDRRMLFTFPNMILERCWFLECEVGNTLTGCPVCFLTYCPRHIPQEIHGCALNNFDYGSRLKKSGADYASSKVKTLGRLVEKKTINPETCNCSGHCYTCKFAGAFNKHFLPKPKPVNVTKEDQQYAQSASDMDANGNGKRDIPKLRDIIRRQRQDSDGGGVDSPDLDFVYDDTDTAANEIAELYSYTEQPEFLLNVKAFEDQMEQYNFPPSWQKLQQEARKSIVMKLLDQLEISNKVLRMRAARCILYICQGCWAEVQSDTEQQDWAHRNSLLLFELGVFSAFTDLLNIEIENSAAAHVAMRKLAVSLADSQDLRVILAVLYTITEAIRNEKKIDSSEHKSKVETFTNEIVNATGDDLLVIKLLGMVTKFCNGSTPHFPMKKVLLLLWKLILVSLGGMEELRQAKMDKRAKAGLSPLDEDTVEIAKNMRASSPPASASDLLETQNQKRNIRMFRRNLMKQSSLDDHDSITMVLEGGMSGIGEEIMKNYEYDERRPNDNNERMYGDYQQRPMTPPMLMPIPRGLPWKPKVRQRDIDNFLKNVRMKFIGYALQDDRDCLAGLPQPIHEGVKTLKEHMYTSLADLQIQKEEEIARIPLSSKEEEIEMTPTEALYQAMLPNLPQYMIALLKILLAAAPTSKPKTDSINIVSDVLPEEMPMTVVQSMKLGLDVNRHKEIIVKAVSAILLLLLKHFKLNHVCQFEFMSQHLVFANCIPLVLKFFNQHVMTFVAAINMIPILDFPACVIGDQPELTAESLEIGYAAPYSWRNIYSCINLLRILNKLTKWKHSRIMMLVVFKSAPILKRTLKVRHAMTQLYVLKLLKMQTKYLGRQWRKSNMKTISAIYAKVRHHLNDDWAFGNDLDARPWDFQGEECALRASVDRFNNRRYSAQPKEADFEPVDNCLNSVLGANHDLSENFKKHYHLWLEQEVYNVSVDWDKLLLN